jgi:hypothetical protein
MITAAVYARKSIDQSIPDEEKSVTRQVEHAKAYAARRGWMGGSTIEPCGPSCRSGSPTGRACSRARRRRPVGCSGNWCRGDRVLTGIVPVEHLPMSVVPPG